MEIRNREDLRLSYMMLRIAEKQGNMQDFVKKQKEEIRNYYRHEKAFDQMRQNERLVKDYGIDGYILLYALPETLKTEKEADNFFNENERIYYRDYGFDCTGQLFTSWYKIFKRRNRFYVYHSFSRDV